MTEAQDRAFAAMLIEMAQRHDADRVAAELVAEFEGLELRPYRCPANVPTIGCGRTRYADGRPVSMSDPPCTRGQAMEWLAEDLASAFQELHSIVVPLTTGQRAACASLIFNVGRVAFRASTLRRHLVIRRFTEAADQFPRWNRGGGRVLPGLVRRRRVERWVFLGDVDA